MLRLLSVVLALTSLPVALGHGSCSSTTTVTSSIRGSGIHCDLECIVLDATQCSPGQLPTPPPAVQTTTSGCTVSIVTDAPPECGPCATCRVGPTPEVKARATHHSSCTSTSTVHTSLTNHFQCLPVCGSDLTTCSSGQSPTTPPAIQTTTSGCTVSVITDAPGCNDCPTCALPVQVRAHKTTTPPCPTPTATIFIQEPVTEICECPFVPGICVGGETPTVKAATTITKTSACTASVLAERPDCSFVCPSCPA